MNPQISFDNLRSSIFEFRLRACVLLYFWHDLLVPKTLEAHLTSFTKNKEIGSTSASFREGSKMSKRLNSISCRTFQGPFDLQTTLESGLQLWKLQISDFWGQRSWQLEVFLSWMYCAISQLKYVIHFRERVQNPQKCRDHRQKPFLFASEAVRAVKRARIQREKDAKKQKATEQRILFLKSFFCTSSAFQVTKSKGRSFTKKVF